MMRAEIRGSELYLSYSHWAEANREYAMIDRTIQFCRTTHTSHVKVDLSFSLL